MLDAPDPPLIPGRQDWRQYLLIGIVSAACTFLMLLPQNLYSTLSPPAFVTYMGIGNAGIRLDIRQGAGISLAAVRLAAALERDEQAERYAIPQTRSRPTALSDGNRGKGRKSKDALNSQTHRLMRTWGSPDWKSAQSPRYPGSAPAGVYLPRHDERARNSGCRRADRCGEAARRENGKVAHGDGMVPFALCQHRF